MLKRRRWSTKERLIIIKKLTIRLRARDFYAVIVDKGEARSNLIVLVESEVKHGIIIQQKI